MAEIVFLALARADLDSIWRDIAADNRTAADRMIRRILGGIERLADHPLSAPLRPQLGEKITVIRILHGARDLPEELAP